MLFLIRGLLWTVALIGITTCSLTVKLGDRTAVQHARRIWATPETREMVEGVEQQAGPVLEKVKRGVAAGVREAAEVPDAGPIAAEPPADAGPSAPDAGPPPNQPTPKPKLKPEPRKPSPKPRRTPAR